MDEMNIQPIDLRHKLRQSVQLVLELAPVVIIQPVAGDGLNRRRTNALRCVVNCLVLGPPRRSYAPAKIDQFRLLNVHTKRTIAD